MVAAVVFLHQFLSDLADRFGQEELFEPLLGDDLEEEVGIGDALGLVPHRRSAGCLIEAAAHGLDQPVRHDAVVLGTLFGRDGFHRGLQASLIPSGCGLHQIDEPVVPWHGIGQYLNF